VGKGMRNSSMDTMIHNNDNNMNVTHMGNIKNVNQEEDIINIAEYTQMMSGIPRRSSLFDTLMTSNSIHPTSSMNHLFQSDSGLPPPAWVLNHGDIPVELGSPPLYDDHTNSTLSRSTSNDSVNSHVSSKSNSTPSLSSSISSSSNHSLNSIGLSSLFIEPTFNFDPSAGISMLQYSSSSRGPGSPLKYTADHDILTVEGEDLENWKLATDFTRNENYQFEGILNDGNTSSNTLRVQFHDPTIITNTSTTTNSTNNNSNSNTSSSNTNAWMTSLDPSNYYFNDPNAMNLYRMPHESNSLNDHHNTQLNTEKVVVGVDDVDLEDFVNSFNSLPSPSRPS